MDATGNWQWATKAGGSDYDIGYGITIDDLGNTYVTGKFCGTATFGSYSLTSNGGYDIFVAKMDSIGNWQWATKAGGSSDDCGRGITIDDLGNTYVTGYFIETSTFGSYSLISNGDMDIFVAKMDSIGNWQWATKAGGSGWDYGYGITIADLGNTYVTGGFQGTSSFGSYSLTSNGGYDIFVAKMDSIGNWQWATKAGGSSWDYEYGITIDDLGNTYVTGKFQGTSTFGSYSLTSNGSYDIFVAKMDSIGNWQWATKAGGSSDDCGRGITIDDLGNTYVTGYFCGTASFGSYSLTSNGGADIFVAKYRDGLSLIADFTASDTTGFAPLTVQFADLSTGNPTIWQWDFQNDGVYDSFVQNPSFTYDAPGIYDVKLKISNETQVDSLIKYNYITVFDTTPPAPPQNVHIEVVGDDAVITWSPVDTTIYGTPITVDYYLVFCCGTPDSVFYFHGATQDTTYTHYYVAKFCDQMFYRIESFVGYKQELDEYIAKYLLKREDYYRIGK